MSSNGKLTRADCVKSGQRTAPPSEMTGYYSATGRRAGKALTDLFHFPLGNRNNNQKRALVLIDRQDEGAFPQYVKVERSGCRLRTASCEPGRALTQHAA